LPQNGKQERGAVVELPTVLVVEDDDTVQDFVADVLNDGGFEPAIARTGEEAVTLLKGRQTLYCALVTDINLPGGTSGWDVARAAREIDPKFPVVYMTGAAADEWAVQGVPNSLLLRKPFAPAQVVTAIAQLLNVGSTPVSND
jgi:DNA-binding response OmpR family regulator